MATHYSDNLSEEVRKGLSEKAKGGDYPMRAPSGYLNDRNTRKLEIDPVRGPMIRRAFELYGTGQSSLADIRREMNAIGYTSPVGGRIAKSGVEQILKNPIYCGQFDFRGVRYEGNQQPIVSRELFDRVQVLLSRGKPTPYVAHGFAFAKFMTCGHCECLITAGRSKGKYIYYRCTQGRGQCPQVYVREEKLVGQFQEVVQALVVPDTFAEWIKAALTHGDAAASEHRRTEVRRLNGEIARLESRLDQAYVDKLDGQIAEAFWLEKSKSWKSSIAEHRRRLDLLAQGDQALAKKAHDTLELVRSAPEAFMRRSPHEQREWLHHVLLNCRMAHGRVVPEYRKPFALLALAAKEMEAAKRNSGPEGPGTDFKSG